MEEKIVTVGGLPLCYREVGSGPPLVFASGWSLEYSYWNLQIEALRKSYRVIAYDRRGQGCSGGGNDPYEFQTLVTELAQFLDAVLEDGGELPVLIGHSLAGSLVLQLAIQYPERLKALVVADTPPATGGSVAEGLELAGFKVAVATCGLASTTAINKHLFWSESFQEANPGAMALWEAQYQSNSTTKLVNSLAAWVHRPEEQDHLGRITIPTLLLVGSEDAIVSVREMTKIQKGIFGSVLQVLAGAGHMSFFEKPDEFTRCLQEFLKGL